MYVLLAAFSIVNVCASFTLQHYRSRTDASESAASIVTSLATLFMSHIILILFTALHDTPTIAPYDNLLWLMRAAATMFFGSSILRFLDFTNEYPIVRIQ